MKLNEQYSTNNDYNSQLIHIPLVDGYDNPSSVAFPRRTYPT